MEDSGFIPLGEAIEWIAWRGAEVPTDEEELHRRWHKAELALRERAEEGEVVARGQKQGAGRSEAIPEGVWAPTTTISPLADSLTLQAPNGLPEREPLYTIVRVKKLDLRKFWPRLGEGSAEAAAEVGRPEAWPWAETEAKAVAWLNTQEQHPPLLRLTHQMQEWCNLRYQKAPSETALKDKLRPIWRGEKGR